MNEHNDNVPCNVDQIVTKLFVKFVIIKANETIRNNALIPAPSV